MAAPSKSALSLLQDYDDGESNEDDFSEDEQFAFKSKRKKLDDRKNSNKEYTNRLPLPSALKLSKNEENVANDDPELHKGRIRSFPHERGNWPTFIYIPYELTPSVEAFIDVAFTCLASVDVKPVADFHISLSRTIVLRHHWIDLLVQSLQQCAKALPRFQISFGSVKIYCNEERTRTFIGLEVSEGLDTLKECISRLDKCLAEFKLPSYYKDPSFHLSIGWVVGDVEKQMQTLLPQLDNAFKQFIFANAAQWSSPVTQFQCKSGNKLFVFQLMS